MKKRETLSLSISILRIAVMGIFLSGAAVAGDWQGYAAGWLDAGNYDSGYQQQYYPYFGEEFFTSGSGNHSQQAIEAQRMRFEAPFLPYFGQSFFSGGETYPFAYLGEVFPLYAYKNQSAYPSTYPYQYPWMSRPEMLWPQFQKNWTRTVDYARNNSSFRIYSGGSWMPA